MTWIQHALHERRKKRKLSMLCNHLAQRWSGLARVLFLRRILQKLPFAAEVPHVCDAHSMSIHPGFFSNYYYFKTYFRCSLEYSVKDLLLLYSACIKKKK